MTQAMGLDTIRDVEDVSRGARHRRVGPSDSAAGSTQGPDHAHRPRRQWVGEATFGVGTTAS